MNQEFINNMKTLVGVLLIVLAAGVIAVALAGCGDVSITTTSQGSQDETAPPTVVHPVVVE